MNKYDIEYWKEAARLNNSRANHAEHLIQNKNARIAELESALRHVLIGRDKWRVEALMRGKPSTRATIESVLGEVSIKRVDCEGVGDNNRFFEVSLDPLPEPSEEE